jgi:hypothetical protein
MRYKRIDLYQTSTRKNIRNTRNGEKNVMSGIKDVLKLIKDEEIDYVDIRFTDPKGKLQHVTVMEDQVDEEFLVEGFMYIKRNLQYRSFR